MNKLDIIIGFVIGIVTSILGSYLFITFFTSFDISNGLETIKQYGYLGKIVTLGTILDLALFLILLKRNKEMMARGVVFAVIVLAITTLFI
jgi:putative flippase GtrA